MCSPDDNPSESNMSPDDRPLLHVELGEGRERCPLDCADGDDGTFRTSGLGLFEENPVVPFADDFDDPLVAEVPVVPLGIIPRRRWFVFDSGVVNSRREWGRHWGRKGHLCITVAKHPCNKLY